MLDSLGSTFTEESIDSIFNVKGLSTVELKLSYEQMNERLESRMAGGVGDSVCHEKLSSHTAERLSQINSCPLCARNLDELLDLDIISHISVCSLDDSIRLDNFLLGGFLADSYTSPNWITKIISRVAQKTTGKISGGQLLCLDRMTGQLVEEKIPMYIRLGIRLLFQFYGSRTIIETQAIKKLLVGLTLKQGSKFNDPRSKTYIQTFINYHKLNTDEGKREFVNFLVLEPLENFNTFNQFFYRKLKEDARILSSPEDPV